MILRWIATATTGGRRRHWLALFAVVAGFAVWSVMRLRGDPVMFQVDAFLQTSACLGAIACGLVTAFRAEGFERGWRLLAVATIVCWLTAQAFWWWHALVLERPSPTPVLSTIGYHAFVVLAIGAVWCAAWSSRRDRIAASEPRSPHANSVLLVDGLVSTASFAILAWSARVDWGGFAMESGGRPITVAYSVIGLWAVVGASVAAIGCNPRGRTRANILLLAAGVITIIASDRVIAYLNAVGFDDGNPWARTGFVVGPLLIGYGTLRLGSGHARPWKTRAMAWTQLMLPYLGVIGISVFLAIHVLSGHPVDAVQVALSVGMVFLLVARQVLALHENRILLDRVLAAQSHLIHQVNHDSLTGLPTRGLFAERLDEAMAQGGPFVLLYIDLDDFKDVNDRFGHAAGDRLLRTVGQRLGGCAGESDTVARIAGDEFAVLVRGVSPPEVVADRYRAVFRPPFAVHGQSVSIRVSMGVVTPDPYEPAMSTDEFLRRADAAMYTGKRAGKDTTTQYQQSADAAIDFPAALRRADGALPDGFHVLYQPIVRLPEAIPVAVEALSRWTAPNGTSVPPETIVAGAEAAGLGADFDALVLDHVCREIAATGVSLTIHVNIGAARLGDREFESRVREILRRHRIAPRQLVLEITESVPVVDIADGAAAIRRLRDAGIAVALDDFGAGYNSLTYLHALPVDSVKLDRSLMVGIGPENDAVLYRSVLGICDQLGLEVITEGVETTAQAEMIDAAGCRYAQGYHFGRPAPLADVTGLPALGVG